MPVKTRKRLKSDHVYEVLRERIRMMELAPGALLNKEEIAAEFEVSIAPVVDAIARLAEEGLAEVFPQHGSFVASIREEDVREGLFIRTGLETEAVRAATALKDQNLCAALKENIAAQEKALLRRKLAKLYELDEAMHAAIFNSIGLDRAVRVLEIARAPADRMRRLVLPSRGRPEATLREHRWIVEAICTGDPDFAAAAMRAHLNNLKEVVESQLAILQEQSTA
jgi:DNA-binding GntR family transcriptional regulator